MVMPQRKNLLQIALAATLAAAPLAQASYTDAEEASGVDPVIPARLSHDGNPLLHEGVLRHSDYSAVQHALASAGRIMRDSEMGHEDYHAELAGEPRKAQAEAWVQVQQQAAEFLMADTPAGTMEQDDGQWVPGRGMGLAELAPASFSYHMHHSGGRWADLDADLEQQITYGSVGYLGGMTERLHQVHYEDGSFHNTDGDTTPESLAQGLDALHALAYSWVRWDKPGGADDMGQLDQQRLEDSQGVTLEELLSMSRDLANTLHEAWDEERSAYDLGQGTTYDLDTLGSLIRGHKGLYEILYVFGEESDKEQARMLFDHKADMLLALFDSADAVQAWGIAERLSYTDSGVEADSEQVDTEKQWRFLNHLTGGFATTREREGTSEFLEQRPELQSRIGLLSDRLLNGAMEHLLDDDGLMVRRVALEDGEVLDDAHQVAAIGWFVTAAGNAYRAGNVFERPGDWGDDELLAERSSELYDSIRTNNDWLLDLIE